MTSPNEEYNRKNGIPNPIDYEANTFKYIKEINLYFYGADDPILYGYDFLYTPTIAFNSTQEVKETFLKSHASPLVLGLRTVKTGITIMIGMLGAKDGGHILQPAWIIPDFILVPLIPTLNST